MFNRNLLVVPASLAVLAFGAASASADTFLLGSNDSSTNQGINNSQTASQTNAGGGSGTTIVNRSSYNPSTSQGATNANVNAPAAAPTTTGDTFSLGSNKSSTNQGINNNQAATQGTIGGGSGTTIINRSSYNPSISQGVTNANVNVGSAGPSGSGGDLFLLGGNTNNLGQAINSSQSGSQAGGTSGGGALIVNNSGFNPSTSQGACNVNTNNSDATTALFVIGLACG